MMNNFFSIYLIIGFILYTTIIYVLYTIGIDNFKNLTNDDNIKNIDLNSILPNVILLILCLFFWPVILTNTFINNKNN